jgi:hypothetical protein
MGLIYGQYAPPRSVMNPRRLKCDMGFPSREERGRQATDARGQLTARLGCSESIGRSLGQT